VEGEKGDTIQASNIVNRPSIQASLAPPPFLPTLPPPSPASTAFHTPSPGTPIPPEASLPYELPPLPPTTASREEKDRINREGMRLAREAGVKMAKENRPKNTTEAYQKPVRLWAEFCKEREFADGEEVYEAKLMWFLMLEVEPMRVEPAKKRAQTKGRRGKKRAVEELSDDDENENPEDGPQPLKWSTVDGYVNAIIDLYNRQLALQLHNHPHPRGAAVKGWLRAYKANAHKRTRQYHLDRAINTILDTYTEQDRHNFVTACFEQEKQSESYLRTMLDFLVGHNFLLRGQLRRGLELADMHIQLLKDEGVQECYAWILLFDNGKTNGMGKKQYLGSMRHKDVLACSQMALAQYLFNRFHVHHERWPDMSSPKAWDTIKVLHGGDDDIKRELNRKTHGEWIGRINLYASQTTHLTRRGGSVLAELCGVVETEVSRFDT
jgi:hypothetical protein